MMQFSFRTTDQGGRAERHECKLVDDRRARAEALRFVARCLDEMLLEDCGGRDIVVDVTGEGGQAFEVRVVWAAKDGGPASDDPNVGEGHPS